MCLLLEITQESRAFYSFLGLIILVIICSLTSSDFSKIENYITIFRQASVLLVLSAGLTAVLILGGIDLSVGATAALVGCTCALLLKAGVPTWAVITIGLCMGAVIGTLNGFLVSIIRLPAFVATYATNWIVKGLAIVIMNGQIIFNLPESFTFIGTGYLFGQMPVLIVIALVVVSICYVLYQKTTIGRDIFSCGSNLEAARYSGIRVKRAQFVAFIMSSMFAGLAGLLMTARLNAAEASMGDSYGLNTVAAVVIGGTSMLGGEGGIIGTMIGSIMLMLITNIMNLLGISSFAQPMIIGLVIIVMVFFDSISRDERKTVRRGVAIPMNVQKRKDDIG